MQLTLPPTWLQNREYPARIERMMLSKYFQAPGVVSTSAFRVTAQSTPNMTLNVAAGSAWVAGTQVTNQGYYNVVNDSIAIINIPASNTSSRTDIIVLTIYDSEYAGSFNTAQIEVITGSPGGGTPATPGNSIRLATVTVGANVTSITNANIVDSRPSMTTNNRLIESWVQDVPWIQITAFKSNFAAHASYTKPHYRVVGGDTVELAGLVVANTALPNSAATPMFTLPITFPSAPAIPTIYGLSTVRSLGQSAGTAHTHLVQQSSAEGFLNVSTNGDISFRPDEGFVSGEYICLDGTIIHLST